MNYQIKCPDCQSDKLTIHGYGYDSIALNALQCMECGFVFHAHQAIVKTGGTDNLKRLSYMVHQFNKAKSYNLLCTLTNMSKKEAKTYVTNIRFEDIKTDSTE